MTKTLKTQRRIAARLLKCGETRVWFDPEALDEIEKATTAEEIRKLIKERKIWKYPIEGVSHHRANKRAEQRRKGRRRGPGKRKGARGAREGEKTPWVQRIRAIRKILRKLRDYEVITPHTHEMLRKRAKAGVLKSKRHVIEYIVEHQLNVAPVELVGWKVEERRGRRIDLPEDLVKAYEEYIAAKSIVSELKKSYERVVRFEKFLAVVKKITSDELKPIVQWAPKKYTELMRELVYVMAKFSVIRPDAVEPLKEVCEKLSAVEELLEKILDSKLNLVPLELFRLPDELIQFYERLVKNGPDWEGEILKQWYFKLREFEKTCSDAEKPAVKAVLSWVEQRAKARGIALS